MSLYSFVRFVLDPHTRKSLGRASVKPNDSLVNQLARQDSAVLQSKYKVPPALANRYGSWGTSFSENIAGSSRAWVLGGFMVRGRTLPSAAGDTARDPATSAQRPLVLARR